MFFLGKTLIEKKCCYTDWEQWAELIPAILLSRVGSNVPNLKYENGVKPKVSKAF